MGLFFYFVLFVVTCVFGWSSRRQADALSHELSVFSARISSPRRE